MLVPILLFVVVAGVILFFMWNSNNRARAAIEAELSRRHFKNVTIKPDWMDWDRGTFTYDVSYTDAHDRRLSNRCKVAIHPRADRSLFWKDPLPAPHDEEL